jgi:plasmid maintenance system antidote protein VapI
MVEYRKVIVFSWAEALGKTTQALNNIIEINKQITFEILMRLSFPFLFALQTLLYGFHIEFLHYGVC